jgi:probable F420-dependent oxidoreductase
MRMGITIPHVGLSLRELPALVRQIEELGYESVWSAEATELDGFTPIAVAAEHSERLRLVTGVVNVFTRGPAVLAQTAAALADLSDGRFVLGLGVSSNVIVERWNGIPFERPLARMRSTVDYVRTALAGERTDGGFRLGTPPQHEVPIVVAALRERMLELAGEIGDGAFANFLPLSGVRQVVEAFGAPEKELACRFFSFQGPEEEVLETAKRVFVAYATVPVYTDFFRWLGHGEELDPVVEAWNAGDRAGALGRAPERLVREVFLLGPVEKQRERLAAFAEAGIDTAVLALIGQPDSLNSAVEAFAPA